MTSSDSTTVVMYSTEQCPFCLAARMLLKKKDVPFEDILVSENAELRARMEQLSGRSTVPQIFINDEPIGGFDELYALDQRGQLDKLLGG
ncbi:MAG: glutaredoxin 3 [Woeseiaceae bacterium]